MVIILDMDETFSIMYEVKVGVVMMDLNQHQRPITHGQMEPWKVQKKKKVFLDTPTFFFLYPIKFVIPKVFLMKIKISTHLFFWKIFSNLKMYYNIQFEI